MLRMSTGKPVTRPTILVLLGRFGDPPVHSIIFERKVSVSLIEFTKY